MATGMHWMIVYDIKNSRRLLKVEKRIECYAWRLQYSVWESAADESSMQTLKRMLISEIDTEKDFVLIFRVCERDWQKRELYGKAVAQNPMNRNYIIV